MKIIAPQQLTAENFAVFGDVIEAKDCSEYFEINDGHTQRFNDLANIDLAANNGKTLVNIFRSTPLLMPIKIRKMERHPLSSQSFIPMGEEPYLVIVAPAGDFEESAIQVFIASSKQGVNYSAGTWHHYSLALNQVSDFLVIDREGEEKNCDEAVLNEPFIIGPVSC